MDGVVRVPGQSSRPNEYTAVTAVGAVWVGVNQPMEKHRGCNTQRGLHRSKHVCRFLQQLNLYSTSPSDHTLPVSVTVPPPVLV